jgi:hypothetical protein
VLANCYFSQDSSGFSVLLRFFDAQSCRSFHPFHRRPSSVARSWRGPFPHCGVAAPQAPDHDLESLPQTISGRILHIDDKSAKLKAKLVWEITGLRLLFAMGKIRGTPYMRSHMSVHRATTKYFSNSFVFKTEIEKEGLPGDSAPALGAGGPRFKSGRPDQIISRIFFSLSKTLFTQYFVVEFCQTGGLNSQAV